MILQMVLSVLSLLSILVALPFLYIGLLLIRVSWVASGPEWQWLALLLLWISGVYGVAGLAANLIKPDRLSLRQIQLHQVLLICGMLASIPLFLLGAVVLQGIIGSMLPLLIFPGAAVLTAMARLLSFQRSPGIAGIGKIVGFLLLVPVVLALAAVGLRESMVWWYGHDLLNRIHSAAQQSAKADSYCITANPYFLQNGILDQRAAVLMALRQRFDFGPNTQFMKTPHFILVAEDQSYYWSFKRSGFTHSRYPSERLGDINCLVMHQTSGN